MPLQTIFATDVFLNKTNTPIEAKKTPKLAKTVWRLGSARIRCGSLQRSTRRIAGFLPATASLTGKKRGRRRERGKGKRKEGGLP